MSFYKLVFRLGAGLAATGITGLVVGPNEIIFLVGVFFLILIGLSFILRPFLEGI